MPYVGGINKFIEALTGEYKYDLSIHFACGAGYYIFVDPDGKIIPITEFVDAAGMLEHLQKAVNEMEGKSKLARRVIAVKTLSGISKFIDKKKQPKSVNFTKLLMSVLLKHDFATMGNVPDEVTVPWNDALPGRVHIRHKEGREVRHTLCNA